MAIARVSAQNLIYQLDGKVLLTIPQLDLAQKRVAVIGRNGSGKTTFVRLLAGLIKPTQGLIELDGIDPFDDRKAAIRTVGILFQNPDHQIIFPTVIEEIAFGLAQLGHSKNDSREQAHLVLKRFNRQDWSERSIVTLSQGQRHLVCLMSVLAMSPKIIILDEPFSGLDIPTKAALNAEFSQLDQSIIHITHDTNSIENYDTVIWLEQGQIAQVGRPDQVIPAYIEAMSEAVTL